MFSLAWAAYVVLLLDLCYIFGAFDTFWTARLSFNVRKLLSAPTQLYMPCTLQCLIHSIASITCYIDISFASVDFNFTKSVVFVS